MKFKNLILSFLVLFFIWILYNNTFDLLTFGIGFLISLVTAIVFCKKCDVFGEFKFTPSAFFYTAIYIAVFLAELIKSNLDVAYRVISPSLPINPGIVEVKTKLKSKMARMLLANSITLTPGTLTVDIIDDTLFIHWIDVKSDDIELATKEIVSKFEKYLSKIYD
ncbi:MAG: Na+/H+ antiporter subunit E [Saprospiraceae bacterium]|nr:Na+/H+ antiporter subunit E [Saprospiraceae bacterium]